MKRTKLIAMVSTLCLSLVMLLVGIWAAVIVNFNLYGNLTFAPEGVFVEISGQVFRGNSVETLEPITNDPRYTLEPQTNFDNSTGEPSGNFPIPSWEIDNLVFAPMLKFIQIELYITNYSDFSITSTPNVTIGGQEISSVTDFNVTNYTTELEEIAPTTTATYKLTIEVTSSTAEPKNLSVSFSFNEWLPPDEGEFPMLTFTSNGDGTASVKADSSNLPTGELTIPEKVLINEVPHTVTTIGYSAFYDCSSLTSITIPDSVTSIGEGAFNGCSSLESITIPNFVTSIDIEVFLGCSSLTSITIPDSVTSIGRGAFWGCSKLTSITIPDSVTSISYFAFSDCRALESITIPNSVTSIDREVFSGCRALESITIPDSVTSIGERAFYGCSSLTNITIPEGVTSIGGSAFSGCSSLTNITIPEGVTWIDGYAFDGCSSLKSITIPEGVTSISDGVFNGCSSLESITIPNSVISIYDYPFDGCSRLRYIHMQGAALESAYSLPSGTWVKTDSPGEPTSWTNPITSIPAGTSGYFHQKSAWDLV